MKKCLICGQDNPMELDVFKHRWEACTACRCASSRRKDKYPLEAIDGVVRWFLRQKKWSQTEARILKDQVINDDATKPWDAFLTPEHIEIANAEAKCYFRDIFIRYGLDVKGKEVLELSGGSGDNVFHLLSEGAKRVVLSEFNKEVVQIAKQRLGIEAFFYDCNAQALKKAIADGLGDEVAEEKFDYIFSRYLIMFVDDMERFLLDSMECLKDDGKIIIEGAVMTTIGAMNRMGLDEFGFTHLYSPEYLRGVFKKVGLEIVAEEKKVYDSMYAYDFDRYPLERHIQLFYEYSMTRKFAKFSAEEYQRLEFNARDIRYWNFVLAKAKN